MIDISDLIIRPAGDWHERQLSGEECRQLGASAEWKGLTDEELFNLGFFQRLLCIPFGELHRVTSVVLDRPVWTHEFAFRGHLLAELRKAKPKSTVADVVGLLPKDKVLTVDADETPLRARKLL